MLDRPVSLRRLLILAAKVSFPDSDQINNSLSPGSKRQDNAFRMNQRSRGEPTKNLVKEYETHLLMSGFGFVAPNYESYSLSSETALLITRLGMDTATAHGFKSAFNHFGYTHSPLCLIEDSTITALSVYHLSCEMTGKRLATKWYRVLDSEERRLAEAFSSYMSKTAMYVKERKVQLQQCLGFSDVLSPNTVLTNSIGDELPDFQSFVEGINVYDE
jgi:hypothetical protein